MRIADIKRESSLRILLALHVSRKPMTTLELTDATGLATRATRYGVEELRTLGLIEVTRCDSPLYGECRVEYRLKEPLTAYAEKDVREMCLDADEDGSTGAKIAALQSLFVEWFPKEDEWGRLYPQGAKTLLKLTNGSALAVYEGLEDSGANPERRHEVHIKSKNPVPYCIAILKNNKFDKETAPTRHSNGRAPQPLVSPIDEEIPELGYSPRELLRMMKDGQMRVTSRESVA